MSESSTINNGTAPKNAEEINAARHAVMVIARAVKNRSIYPRDHGGIVQMMHSAVSGLESFHRKFGSLRLMVTKHALLYKGEAVLEAEQANDPLIHPMYRDGLIWIEFLPGIDENEFGLFVDILLKHRQIEKEAQSDLVTSLWDSDLPHLAHEAVDPELESTPALDIAVFRIVSENPAEKRAKFFSSPPPETIPERPLPELLSEYDRHSIRHMIEEEEVLTKPEDILDVLLILLVNQNSEKEFNTVLKSLIDTFSESLGKGEIRFCARCLRSIQNLIRKTEHKSRWRFELLGQFLELTCAVPGWRKLATRINDCQFNSRQREAFNFIMKALPEQIMQPAAHLLAATKDEALRRILVETIAFHAQDHPDLLIKLLNEIDADSVLELLEVLEHLEENLIEPILMELSHHKSPKIRSRAIWMLTRQEANAAARLFSLIEDPEPAVRKQVLIHLGSQKNPEAEGLLLDYLQHKQAFSKDKDHILACYQALGKCGGRHSLAFLKEMLLAAAWKDTVNRTRAIHRRGAAKALALLGIPASEEILRKGLASMAPNVRKACRSAMAEARLTSGTKGNTQ